MNELPSPLAYVKWDSEPTLPLKAHGEIRYLGWDISDRWAVDATGRVWAQSSGGHGGPMVRVSYAELAALAGRDDAAALTQVVAVMTALLDEVYDQ